MRMALLSRSAELYSSRRLMVAAGQRGHSVDVIDVMDLAITMEEGYPDLHLLGEPLAEYDAVIPRVGASATFFGTAVVRQLEQMDVFCANSAAGITNSRDKLRCLQMLSRHDIGIPPTEFVSRRHDVMPAIERLGGAPVVIKLLEGTQGVGVILAETAEVAEAIVETFQSAKQNVLLQKFVAESKGKDIRAIVVGERVVAAMRRQAKGQEFRSNVHRGGTAEQVELTPAYTETAVRAARLVGLRVAGVDMLEAADGPQVMEINSSPGLAGIESATGIDVAGAIMDYVQDQVRFPDLDLRQRLAVSHGLGVAEFSVGDLGDLAGKAVATCGLRDREVSILTIYRDGEVIANPRADFVLKPADRLLCFGKLAVIRAFLPGRKPPQVRRLKKASSGSGADPS